MIPPDIGKILKKDDIVIIYKEKYGWKGGGDKAPSDGAEFEYVLYLN